MPRTHAAHHAFERSPGAALAPLPRGYQPRRPQATAFYRVIADHLETMLQDARERSAHGFGLPRHVENSFRRLLDCGIIERGFARVVCRSCHYEILVPFSCKIRGLCPSCDGRRMAAGAAHLVDQVLPLEPDYRQWTLSFPRWLRIRLLRDKALVSEVLLVFVRVVSAYHRRRSRARGVAGGQTGAVTAIQLAGSFANANVHFHTLVPDPRACGTSSPMARSDFTHCRRPPTRTSRRSPYASLARSAACSRVATAMRSMTSPTCSPHAYAEAVQLPMTFAEPLPLASSSRRRCAFVDGFSLHANTSVEAADRPALEMLARYLLRPLISADRLTLRPDGRVEYHFRRPDPTGRTSWVTDGVLAFLTHLDVTARILDHLGLGSAVPPIAPARAPPDHDVPELDLAVP